MEWYLKCLKQYSDFAGRARRTEYWMFFLFNSIFGFVAGFIDGLFGITFFSVVYALALLVPGIAVGVRRLHDIGKSGWMLLVGLIPLIGAIWLIILFCQDSQPGVNEYGENPKELN